mmetsp:Transcript_22091/g.16499  ORF Transcript_22091/g.16499 Transcript_22091/m.16499 type:complete len:81 (+) Transcript_22091:143-385(+)
MTQQEQNMQTIVEDLSEEMKREREEELRASRGSASIAFFDLAHMSTTGKIAYIVGILGSFALIFYLLINKLLAKPVDFSK